MPLFRLTPMLYTRDLQATIESHVHQLGFTCRSHEPEFGWARLQLDEINISFSLYLLQHLLEFLPGFPSFFGHFIR